MLNTISALASPWKGRATQKVVVVNGTHEIVELLESVLDAGHYDMVFVADVDHAYSEIKKTRPNLVILCLAIDDPIGFQVLSMLKLDEDTEPIPVLTYTNEFDRPETDDDDDDDDRDFELTSTQREMPLN
jgi:PleD family two-component response regulator